MTHNYFSPIASRHANRGPQNFPQMGAPMPVPQMAPFPPGGQPMQPYGAPGMMPPMGPGPQMMGPGPMAPPHGMHPGMNQNMRPINPNMPPPGGLPMQSPQVQRREPNQP